MSIWKDFENDCTDYLNTNYGNYAIFTHQGKEDSTRPDILVKTCSHRSFYIEAKHSPAQCGQFVLLPNMESKSFEYSSKNINPINMYAQIIIHHMNQDFDTYKEAGRTGKDIIFPGCGKVFTDWIIDIYTKKDVKFIITNEYTILPLHRFAEYFSVTAKYRIKRSGSAPAGTSRHHIIHSYIRNNYPIDTIYPDGKKLFVTSNTHLDKERFKIEKYEYMFSQRDHVYEIRKLSNTFHANVIFSIEKNNQSGISSDDFIDSLK